MGVDTEAPGEREWSQLTEHDANVLLIELRAPDDDCVVILRVNPTWVQLHSQPLTDQVIEAIAQFEMPAQQRRDEIHPGCQDWLFRFLDGGQLTRFQNFVWDAPRFRMAFAHGPRAVASGSLARGVTGTLCRVHQERRWQDRESALHLLPFVAEESDAVNASDSTCIMHVF